MGSLVLNCIEFVVLSYLSCFNFYKLVSPMLTRIQGVKSTDPMISNYAKPSQQTFLQTDTFIRNPFCLVSSYNY